MKRVMGGIIIVRYIFKAFTNALFKTYRILQIQNPVLNLATVDVPGVIISTPWRPYKHELYLFGHNLGQRIFRVGKLSFKRIA